MAENIFLLLFAGLVSQSIISQTVFLTEKQPKLVIVHPCTIHTKMIDQFPLLKEEEERETGDRRGKKGREIVSMISLLSPFYFHIALNQKDCAKSQSWLVVYCYYSHLLGTEILRVLVSMIFPALSLPGFCIVTMKLNNQTLFQQINLFCILCAL